MTLSIAETCERAARRIEPAEPGGEWRWCQRQLADGPDSDACRVCIGGALKWATSGDPTAGGDDYAQAWGALVRRLPRGLPASWNDAPGRTPQEVVAVLRDVAAQAREGEG